MFRWAGSYVGAVSKLPVMCWDGCFKLRQPLFTIGYYNDVTHKQDLTIPTPRPRIAYDLTEGWGSQALLEA